MRIKTHTPQKFCPADFVFVHEVPPVGIYALFFRNLAEMTGAICSADL
jgi:hypothetical protein